MKTIEEFYNEAMADKGLEEAVSKAHKENRLAEFLTEHGVDGTAEAFEALVKVKKSAGSELSDDELEKAVGGVDWLDKGCEYLENDVKYLFNAEDKVIVDCWFNIFTGTVKKRKTSSNSYKLFSIYYPEYYIEFDNVALDGWYEQDRLAPTT